MSTGLWKRNERKLALGARRDYDLMDPRSELGARLLVFSGYPETSSDRSPGSLRSPLKP